VLCVVSWLVVAGLGLVSTKETADVIAPIPDGKS
jgi:hypothetical protein